MRVVVKCGVGPLICPDYCAVPHEVCRHVGITSTVLPIAIRKAVEGALELIGGAMVGLQSTATKIELGPMLNGWTNYAPTLEPLRMRLM
jgi:hypothetical protein